MNKQEFLAQLREGLSGLPQEDMEERLMFYSELLDDQMEEGLSEEEAVAAAGPVEEIVRQTISDTPLTKIVKERIRPKRRLHAGELVLLVLGAPIWLPLGFAAIAVFFCALRGAVVRARVVVGGLCVAGSGRSRRRSGGHRPDRGQGSGEIDASGGGAGLRGTGDFPVLRL